jgi:hypothetical protein
MDVTKEALVVSAMSDDELNTANLWQGRDPKPAA